MEPSPSPVNSSSTTALSGAHPQNTQPLSAKSQSMDQTNRTYDNAEASDSIPEASNKPGAKRRGTEPGFDFSSIYQQKLWVGEVRSISDKNQDPVLGLEALQR